MMSVASFKKSFSLSTVAIGMGVIACFVGCKDSEFSRRSVEVPIAQFYGEPGKPHRAAVRWQVLDCALMQQVCDNTSLREVSIVAAKRDGTPILPQVAKLPQLEALTIIEAPIRDDELSALSQAEGLTSLELSRTGILGEGLWHLTKLPIKRLVIRDKHLSAEGLKAIASMTELEELELSLPDVHWADLPELASKNSLRSITLTGGTYSFREHGGLKWLVGASQLERLSLSGGNLNDRSLQAISTLSRLQELKIGPCLISEESAKYLAQLAQLRLVDIPNLDALSRGAAMRLAESAEAFEETPEVRPLRG